MGKMSKVARTGSTPGARSRALDMARGRGPQSSSGSVADRARSSEYTEADPGTNQQLVDTNKTATPGAGPSGSAGNENSRTMDAPGRFKGTKRTNVAEITPGTAVGTPRNNASPDSSEGASVGNVNTRTTEMPQRFLHDSPTNVDGAFNQPLATAGPPQKARSGEEVRTGTSDAVALAGDTAQATKKANAPGGTYPGQAEMRSYPGNVKR